MSAAKDRMDHKAQALRNEWQEISVSRARRGARPDTRHTASLDNREPHTDNRFSPPSYRIMNKVPEGGFTLPTIPNSEMFTSVAPKLLRMFSRTFLTFSTGLKLKTSATLPAR